jgi:hypothetical protein
MRSLLLSLAKLVVAADFSKGTDAESAAASPIQEKKT